ncbi:MAG: VTC domain-containing protein, partial [Kiloniellales bacterium]|nr:VTC domain-containing protein [Kiloniellales bacterium]
RDFADNVIGLSGRLKTRLRWYGNTSAPTVMVLEQKVKCGRINRKSSLPLPGLDLTKTTWRELAKLLNEHAEYRCCLAASYFKNPVLRNHYRRQYYVTRGHRLRMTVDSDLTYYDSAATSMVMGGGMGLKTTSQVVEFKGTVERARDLERLLRRIPLRLSRNSKYVMGVDQMRLRGGATFAGQRRSAKRSEASAPADGVRAFHPRWI